jgi:diaminopimelate epimerase
MKKKNVRKAQGNKTKPMRKAKRVALRGAGASSKAAKKTAASAPPVSSAGKQHAKEGVLKRKFEFTKMVASGNDFIVFDNCRSGLKNGPEMAQLLCKRTMGIGADGLIFIEHSKRADFKMRIFNPDGSEAEMCGNGIRCAVLYKGNRNVVIETLAGFLKAEVREEIVKVRMTPPKNLQLNMNVNIDGCIYTVNFINTGVPHAVNFVENLEAANVRLLGRLIRYHRDFAPEGTNVDFAKIIDQDIVALRTYERGVEAETMACGTGSVATALIYHHKFVSTSGSYVVHVQTQGDEVLNVYFDYASGNFDNIWLEGRARIVYKGECYV